MTKYELFHKIELPKNLKCHVVDRLRSCVRDDDGLKLIDRLLTLNPKEKILSKETLDLDFFYKDPMPSLNLNSLVSHVKTLIHEFTALRHKVVQITIQLLRLQRQVPDITSTSVTAVACGKNNSSNSHAVETTFQHIDKFLIFIICRFF